MILAAPLLLAAALGGGGTVLVAPVEAPEPWLGELVSDALPRALAALQVKAIDRDDRLRAQRALGLPPVSMARATAIRLARALGADRVVFGVVTAKGAEIRLSVRMLDVGRAALSAPVIVAGPLADVGALVRAAAFDVALAGPAPPVGSRADFVARSGPSFEALRAYADGLVLRDAAARKRSLRRALALHAGFDEARLALARESVETREWTAALETLGAVAAGGPLSRAARFAEGAALLHLGRYREADEVFTRLLHDERSAAVLANRALARLRLGTGEPKASALLREAAELAPGAPDVVFDLAFALLVEGQAEPALFWLRDLARSRPEDTRARMLLTWALRALGREAEADAEWKVLAGRTGAIEALRTADYERRLERVIESERAPELDYEAWAEAAEATAPGA